MLGFLTRPAQPILCDYTQQGTSDAFGSGYEIPSVISPPSSLGLMVCFIVSALY